MNLPRHTKHPIDTSVYNRMMRKPKDDNAYPYTQVAKIIQDIWGTDPLALRIYRGVDEVLARHIFAVMMRKYTNETLATIGNYIGKDHSTIHASLKAVQNMLDTSKTFKDKFDKIEKRVKELTNK